MRRSRQGRIVNWALIFVIYCSIQVYSATTKATLGEDDETAETDFANEPPNVSPNSKYDDSLMSTEATTGDYETTTVSSNKHKVSGHPTYRPKRFNCTPPAIEQFPRPLMPRAWRKNGGLVVHVIVALFTFLGLAIVCDDYFVSSLDRICEGNHFSIFYAFNTVVVIQSLYANFFLLKILVILLSNGPHNLKKETRAY